MADGWNPLFCFDFFCFRSTKTLLFNSNLNSLLLFPVQTIFQLYLKKNQIEKIILTDEDLNESRAIDEIC